MNLVMTLKGHLTLETLRGHLDLLSPQLEGSTFVLDLLVDARAMSGYEPAARSLFIDWASRHRARLRRVAILTDNTLWKAVVAAMSLAARKPMRTFATAEDAGSWLSSPSV
jgi:hypothetical protein